MVEFISKCENDTYVFAKRLGSTVFEGCIFLLTGSLGAGKTVFVKGLAKGLGYSGLVKSPTYTIMNTYKGRLPIVHFDLYRLENVDDFYDIGGDAYLGADNVCAVEWHTHAHDAMGDDFIEVNIEDLGDSIRSITLKASGAKHTAWLEGIQDDFNN